MQSFFSVSNISCHAVGVVKPSIFFTTRECLVWPRRWTHLAMRKKGMKTRLKSSIYKARYKYSSRSKLDKLDKVGQSWIWTKLDNLDNFDKLDNSDKIGQLGQSWTIRTKLDNSDKIGQFGQSWIKLDKVGQNWTIWTKLDADYITIWTNDRKK